MKTLFNSQIYDANQICFSHIEGWVGDRIWTLCNFLRSDHEQHGVKGSIAEIGVHHGKLFFIISQIANSDEKLIAIDLFEQQALNTDGSGSGSLKIFQSHVDAHFSNLRDRIKIHSLDSLSVTPNQQAIIFQEPVRVFSVDGGHTVAHVLNDLSIAQDVLAARGCVMLDDFMGPAWPSVSEGFFEFMKRNNRRLAPYLIFQNKLFLTTISEHQAVLESLRIYLDNTVGEEILSDRWRYSLLCGSKVLCFA